MAGLFGSARLRDKSLANPEQYQPMFTPTVPESRPMDERMAFPPDLGSAMNVPQMRGGGLFAGGGLSPGRAALAAFLGGLSGGPNPALQLLAKRQEDDSEEARFLRRQDAELAQRKAMYDYELAHPKPFNNDTIADYNFRVQMLGKQAADEWLRSQGDPIVTIPLPGDRIYSGPRSGLGAALGGAVSAPMPQAGTIVDDPRKAGGAAPSGQRRFP